MKRADREYLVVHYDAEKDAQFSPGHTVDVAELTRFVHAILIQPGFEEMFPRLQRIEVEVAASG